MALTTGISSSPSFIPQANAADDEAAAVWMDEAEATMRREYLPRLVQFGLPEDAACFEGELSSSTKIILAFFLAFHGLLSRLLTRIFPVAAYDTDCAKVGELVCEVAAATNAACVAMARHGKGQLRELVTVSLF